MVAALGFPLAGHAATAEPRWLAAMALTTHALAAALWLGAFWPLHALLADRGGDALAEVERFSRRALLGVAALLAAGIILATLRLPSPAALAGSDYGRLVLAKFAGFAILLALAAWNRQRLTPALATGRVLAGRTLSRSILAEMGIAALVLGVTTVLVRTPPPAATHEHAHYAPVRPDIAIATELGGRSALLVLAPGQVGANRIALWVKSPPPAEVWVELEQPALGLGPLRRRLQPDGQGWFAHAGPELAAPGRWTIRLELLVSDFEQVSGEVSADLLPAGGR
jgi:copper transport protein